MNDITITLKAADIANYDGLLRDLEDYSTWHAHPDGHKTAAMQLIGSIKMAIHEARLSTCTGCGNPLNSIVNLNDQTWDAVTYINWDDQTKELCTFRIYKDTPYDQPIRCSACMHPLTFDQVEYVGRLHTGPQEQEIANEDDNE